jgi:ribonuclease-3
MLTGGRRKTAVLGDTMEAVIAAVYLDGGLEAARRLVLRAWGDRIRAARSVPLDAKTALQEWAQARGLPPPLYRDLDRAGPDHAPVFSVEARLEDGRAAGGRAASKRAAQQAAAEALLAIVEAAAR